MRFNSMLLALVGSMLCLFNNQASVLFVNLNSTNASLPFASWNTAATNIQNAIDAADVGDLILVTNGLYDTGGEIFPINNNTLTNRVVVSKAVTVQSVNGPLVTIIYGYQVPGGANGVSAIRCVYLNSGSMLAGFTLTGGATTHYPAAINSSDNSGGGICCQDSTAIVSNCVVVGNSSGEVGGGAYGGTLIGCILSNNLSIFGGAAYSATLTNCILANNTANLTSPTIKTPNNGGGASSCTLNNCLIENNSATLGGGTWESTLFNCTVIGNTTSGTYASHLYNCIIYYNAADNYFGYATNCFAQSGSLLASYNCFTNAPLFVNQAEGDFHLQSNSPCINSGNNNFVKTTTDLDGNPRIIGGFVDVGAYEYQSTKSVLPYIWLEQYGLPTDGTADYADTDGDGMNNWQEWYAGTNPTNVLSVLKMLSLSNSVSGMYVGWQSVSGMQYFLQRSANIGSQEQYVTVQTNINGSSGVSVFKDTNAVGTGPFFYRIGVQR